MRVGAIASRVLLALGAEAIGTTADKRRLVKTAYGITLQAV